MSVTHGARPPKAAVLLAQGIAQDTFRERLKPGDMLLPERNFPHLLDEVIPWEQKFLG